MCGVRQGPRFLFFLFIYLFCLYVQIFQHYFSSDYLSISVKSMNTVGDLEINPHVYGQLT